jgi:hypothetical protein
MLQETRAAIPEPVTSQQTQYVGIWALHKHAMYFGQDLGAAVVKHQGTKATRHKTHHWLQLEVVEEVDDEAVPACRQESMILSKGEHHIGIALPQVSSPLQS